MVPYHGDRDRYKATNHDHEDVVVGRIFYRASVRHTVVKDCRFHDIHAGADTLSMLSPRVWRRRTHRYRPPWLPARMGSAPAFQSLLSTARIRDMGGPTYLLHPYFFIARCKCSKGTSSCPLSTHLAPPACAILL
jgi:hypothetical protein